MDSINNGSTEEIAVPCKKLKFGRSQNGNIVHDRQTEKDSSTAANFDNSGTDTDSTDLSDRSRLVSLEQDDIQSSSGTGTSIQGSSNKEEESGNTSDSSYASSGDWQPRPTGMMAWIHSQIVSGVNPKDILKELLPCVSHVPPDVNPLHLWKLIIGILSEPERRPKLTQVNHLSDVVQLIRESKNIMVLTGAGVSVSCGIPDFRSRNGIYARLAVDFPDLPDPQAMFDVSYFTRDPRPFFKFAKEIYPGQFKPSRSHRFISMLQKTGRLLRNYTQNIDTLEQVAGISNVVQCHGSFATASCFNCHHKVDSAAIRDDVFNQTVPRCPVCPSDEKLAILKPDIVFFGESLPESFHRQMSKDKHEADLLIVIGSSLKVRPVALIPSSLPNHVPQILINREPLSHMQFDVELLGDGDTIVAEICRRLGEEFSEIANECNTLSEIDVLPNQGSSALSESNVSPTNSDGDHRTDKAAKGLALDALLNTGTPDHSDDSNPSSCTRNISADGLEKSNENLEKCAVAKSTEDASPTTRSALNLNIYESDDDTTTTSSHEVAPSGSDFPTCHEKPATTSPNHDESVQTAKLRPVTHMWRSKWKQSISKRLPSGTFYFDGKSRYIFPGAEVAPEEDDETDSSDDDDSDVEHLSTNQKSSDESEEELIGPGRLSSTRRDLGTFLPSPRYRDEQFLDGAPFSLKRDDGANSAADSVSLSKGDEQETSRKPDPQVDGVMNKCEQKELKSASGEKECDNCQVQEAGTSHATTRRGRALSGNTLFPEEVYELINEEVGSNATTI